MIRELEDGLQIPAGCEYHPAGCCYRLSMAPDSPDLSHVGLTESLCRAEAVYSWSPVACKPESIEKCEIEQSLQQAAMASDPRVGRPQHSRYPGRTIPGRNRRVERESLFPNCSHSFTFTNDATGIGYLFVFCIFWRISVSECGVDDRSSSESAVHERVNGFRLS